MSRTLYITFKKDENGIDFNIKNIKSIDSVLYEKLNDFLKHRDGYFYNKGKSFKIRRKLEKEDIEAIFKAKSIKAELIDESCINGICGVGDKVITFGKHKGKKYHEIPLDYLHFLYKELDDLFAYEEIKKRNYLIYPINKEIVSFGRYKGRKWIELPLAYLEWILGKFDKDHEHYKNAVRTINYLSS